MFVLNWLAYEQDKAARDTKQQKLTERKWKIK